jgi:hypothetical protein
LVEIRGSDDLVRALDGQAIAIPDRVAIELERGAELPIRIRVPLDAAPGLGLGLGGEPIDEPALLDEGEVIQQAGKSEL